MYIVMDMGTSNTRLWLCDNDILVGAKKGAFGAGSSKSHGKAFLFDSLKALVGELLGENSVTEDAVEYIFVSGMAGSNIGLYDLPHIPLPAGIGTLAENLKEVRIAEITAIPFVFVPGLKKLCGDEIADVMRGEETETAGIIRLASECADAVLVLPGTHNKVIATDGDGMVTDFFTSFSGELLNIIISHSILTGQVMHGTEIVDREVLSGADFAKVNGLNAAIFHIRVMWMNGKSVAEMSSFLYGAVMGQDVELIKRMAQGRRVYVGGRESLKRVYGLLLGEGTLALDAEVADNAVRCGLCELYKMFKNRKLTNR